MKTGTKNTLSVNPAATEKKPRSRKAAQGAESAEKKPSGRKAAKAKGAKLSDKKPRNRKVVESVAHEPLVPPNVAHAAVYPNPNQPRKEFDAAYITDLARSICQTGGLVQAVKLVPRPHPSNPALQFMIVAGECRWRAFGLLLGALASRDAATMAVLGISTEVPWWPATEPKEDLEVLVRVCSERFQKMAATVTVMTDSEVEEAAIIENLVRRNISPIEEARAFQRRLVTLQTEYPQDTEEQLVERLAVRLGLKQSWRITERTSLLRLNGELQDAFQKGLVTASQATEMSRLKPAHQRVLFEAIRDGQCKTYAELRRAVQALLDADAQPLPMFLPPPSDGGAEGPRPAGVVFEIHGDHQPFPGLPGLVGASHEDRLRATALEAKVDAVLELLKLGFDGNDVVVLRRVSRANADVLADKLGLIQTALKNMELTLRAAAIVERAQAAGVADADAVSAQAVVESEPVAA